MKASRLLEEKDRLGRGGVVSVKPDTTVLEAAQLMNMHRIGAVLVLEGGRRLAGVFTERDVLTRVVSKEKNPALTTVKEVMTTAVACCEPETPLEQLRDLMREKRIRHVPIVEDDAVVGMVSIGDLNAAEAKTMVETISYLKQYMYQP